MALPDAPRAPGPDEGLLTVDTPEGPARVALSEGDDEAGEGVACETPCTLVLPRGRRILRLSLRASPRTRWSLATAQVGERPSVLRHTLGRSESPHGAQGAAVLLGSAGVVAGIVGVALTSVGAAEGSTRVAGREAYTDGLVVLGVGAALGLAAWIVGAAGRQTRQPGASVQWTP